MKKTQEYLTIKGFVCLSVCDVMYCG